MANRLDLNIHLGILNGSTAPIPPKVCTPSSLSSHTRQSSDARQAQVRKALPAVAFDKERKAFPTTLTFVPDTLRRMLLVKTRRLCTDRPKRSVSAAGTKPGQHSKERANSLLDGSEAEPCHPSHVVAIIHLVTNQLCTMDGRRI